MSHRQPGEFTDRSAYRRRMEPSGLAAFVVRAGESDLHISASRELPGLAGRELESVRAALEGYIRSNPKFRTTLEPWPEDPAAPQIVREMIAAGATAGVGPMAAVAGAVAAAVGRRLLGQCREVIVENGGDIFIAGREERIAAIFAGDSPLSMKLGLKLPPAPAGCGLATSSGTVGPSLSFGKADAAVAFAADAALADAAATAIGNRVKRPEDLAAAMEFAEGIPGLAGALAVIGENLAAWGEMELVEL
ncbi:MAG TPA: UPF0280 family protein [Planctomycetota bacterium]|nr:UPF0280 family protein [Planctomycetota bacterium]